MCQMGPLLDQLKKVVEMKIGLSYSRCVRDIYEGKVDMEDVLVVVARTDFDPNDDEQWAGIWSGYGGGQTMGSPFSNPEWNSIPEEDEDKVRAISITLYNDGKFHQPRRFGAYPKRMPYYWLEAVLPDDELNQYPAAKSAWEKFKMIAGLTNLKLDENKQ